MIRVELPAHLRTLARVHGYEVEIEMPDEPNLRSVLDALENKYPVLRGAIRDRSTLVRRPFVRFFVAGEDWSHDSEIRQLPAAILDGREPLMIVGAIAGGALRAPADQHASAPGKTKPT